MFQAARNGLVALIILVGLGDVWAADLPATARSGPSPPTAELAPVLSEPYQGIELTGSARLRALLRTDCLPLPPSIEDLPALLSSSEHEPRRSEDIFRIMIRIGAPAVPALVNRMKTFKGREHAAASLGHIGPAARQAIPALLEGSANDDREWSQVCSQALLRVSRDDLSALFQRLDDPSPTNRLAATRAIRWLGHSHKPAIPRLIANLKHADSRVREASAETLGYCGEDARPAVMPLLLAMRDGNVAAVTALARLGPIAAPLTLDSLIQEVTPRNGPTRARPRSATDGLRVLPGRIVAAARAMQGMGAPAGEALTPLLKHPDPEMRHLAVSTLAKMSPPKNALPGLIKLLSDSDENCQISAMDALANLGETAGVTPVPFLLAFVDRPHPVLFDRNATLRAHALHALGEIRASPDVVVPRLVQSLDTLSRDTSLVHRVLANYGEPGLQVLRKEVQGKSAERATSAIRAICELGSNSAAEVPMILAFNASHEAASSPLHKSVEWSLSRMGPAAIPGLIDGLKSSDRGTRNLCCRLLGKLAGPDAEHGTRSPGQVSKSPTPRSELRAAVPLMVANCLFDTATGEPSPEVAQALSRIAPEGAQAILAELPSKAPLRRVRVLQALGMLSKSMSVDTYVEEVHLALMAAAGEQDAAVRAAALEGLSVNLAQFPPRQVARLLPLVQRGIADSDPHVNFHAGSVLLAMPEYTLGVLLRMLDGDDQEEKRGAMLVVGRRLLEDEYEPMMPRIMAFLTNENPQVRDAAADTLGRLAARGESRTVVPELPLAVIAFVADFRRAHVEVMGLVGIKTNANVAIERAMDLDKRGIKARGTQGVSLLRRCLSIVQYDRMGAKWAVSQATATNPAYAQFAKGTWKPAFKSEASFNEADKAHVKDGVVSLKEAAVYEKQPGMSARNIMVRAKVRGHGMLTVYGPHWEFSASLSEGMLSGIRDRDVVGTNKVAIDRQAFHEVALAVVENRMILYLDGRRALDVLDSSPPEMRARAIDCIGLRASQDTTEFKDVEFMILNNVNPYSLPIHNPMDRFLGIWDLENTLTVAGQPPEKTTGTMQVAAPSLGGFHLVHVVGNRGDSALFVQQFVMKEPAIRTWDYHSSGAMDHYEMRLDHESGGLTIPSRPRQDGLESGEIRWLNAYTFERRLRTFAPDGKLISEYVSVNKRRLVATIPPEMAQAGPAKDAEVSVLAPYAGEWESEKETKGTGEPVQTEKHAGIGTWILGGRFLLRYEITLKNHPELKVMQLAGYDAKAKALTFRSFHPNGSTDRKTTVWDAPSQTFRHTYDHWTKGWAVTASDRVTEDGLTESILTRTTEGPPAWSETKTTLRKFK